MAHPLKQLPDEVEVDFSKISIGDMTLGELAELEELIGYDSVQRVMHKQVGPKALLALAYLALRKDYPKLKYAEVAARNLDIIGFPSDATSEDESGDEADVDPNPTSASA